MTKTRLNELNMQLQQVFDEIEQICAENPSLMMTEDETNWSFRCIVEGFSSKLALFRRRLHKFADVMPGRRKKNV